MYRVHTHMHMHIHKHTHPLNIKKTKGPILKKSWPWDCTQKEYQRLESFLTCSASLVIMEMKIKSPLQRARKTVLSLRPHTALTENLSWFLTPTALSSQVCDFSSGESTLSSDLKGHHTQMHTPAFKPTHLHDLRRKSPKLL